MPISRIPNYIEMNETTTLIETNFHSGNHDECAQQGYLKSCQKFFHSGSHREEFLSIEVVYGREY